MADMEGAWFMGLGAGKPVGVPGYTLLGCRGGRKFRVNKQRVNKIQTVNKQQIE